MPAKHATGMGEDCAPGSATLLLQRKYKTANEQYQRFMLFGDRQALYE
ncbi:hypothetical protein RvY_02972 [Ramazzottius varieornatus]|uniref:Uncharacterized protein n=1 Tax=Ramazzottius varieornatus TaxID=947166 RepID=A0A1D1UMA3_RAMVA|nr:hypothetical protein RvY_02972 [Ramazzottius varieornatus]